MDSESNVMAEKTIPGTRFVRRLSTLGHWFEEIDYAVYACQRCGLVLCVSKDLSPLHQLENAAIMWHKLGRACA